MHTGTAARSTLAVAAVSLLALTGCATSASQASEESEEAAEELASVEGDVLDDRPGPPGPKIDTPYVEPCPYHEEVSQEDDVQAMTERALELGCEPDIHGGIEFEEPLEEYEDGGGLYGLISTGHALSVQQMCDQGYISDEDCEREGIERNEEAADERQAWAHDKIQAWLDMWNLESVHELLPPNDSIQSWESPDEGELLLSVDSSVNDRDLEMIGAVLMYDTWSESHDLDSVTVRTADGEREGTYTRQDRIGPTTSGEHAVDSQEWADELVDLWVNAEGAESVNGMLYPYTLITSWEASGDGELVIYADPKILDDPRSDQAGELGTLYGIGTMVFDRLYCGVEDLEAVTVTTTDGTDSYTHDRETQAEYHESNYGGCLP